MKTQMKTPYLISILLGAAILASPAQDNPGWQQSEKAPTAEILAQLAASTARSGSPSAAFSPPPPMSAQVAAASLGDSPMLQAPTPTPGGNDADLITPEIEALARGLHYDPVKIFEFVSNYIEFEPYYGSKKGAHLTLLEGSGNDFDQASLLVSLLRASGKSPKYKYGAVDFSYTTLQSWVGLDPIPYSFLNDAQFTSYFLGTPATTVNRKLIASIEFFRSCGYFYSDPFDGGDGEVYTSIPHVWVELNVDGVTRKLTPSFKLHQDLPGINLATATGYTRAQFLTDAAGTVSSNPDSATSLNYAALSSRLTAYSLALKSHLKNNESTRGVDEVTGTRRISKRTYSSFDDVFPLSVWTTCPWLSVQEWTAIPDSQMSKLEIRCGTFNYTASPPAFSSTSYNQTIKMPSLRGRKLSLAFSGNTATIRLDEQTVGTAFAISGVNVDIQLKVTHNHFTKTRQSNGTYTDSNFGKNNQTETKPYLKADGYSYAFVYAFANAEKLSRKRQEVLDTYRRSGIAESDWRVRTETLNIMGLQWMQQSWKQEQVTAPLFNMIPMKFNRFGRVAQEDSYYIDVGLQTTADTNRDMDFNLDQKFFQFSSFITSAMEHGVLEQMQGEGGNASSTVKLLYLANAGAVPVYRAKASNWNAVNSQLTNYPASAKAEIQAGVTANSDPGVALVPKDGQITNAQWKGYGYAVIRPVSALMKISGGYFGGFNSQPGIVSASEIASWFVASPAYTAGTTAAVSVPYTPYTTPARVSTDPVDMLSGAFILDKTELTIGNSAVTRGLSFSRHYNSNRRYDKSPGLGYGWTHSYDISLRKRSSVTAGLGGTISYQAVPFFTALQVASDLYKTQTNAKEWLTAALVTNWAVDQLKYNAVAITMGNRTIEFIRLPDGTYEPPAGMNMTLASHGTGAAEYFTMTERNGSTHTFNTSGQITSITDLWGKTQTFGYAAGELSTVTDGYSRTITFNRTNGRIDSVSDANGRVVVFGFTGDDLTGCTDVEGKIWTYIYDTEHRIEIAKDPSNRVIIENTYDTQSRVSDQLTFGDADKHFSLTYTGYCNIEENPQGGRICFLYDHRGRSIAMVDQLGNKSETYYDGHDRTVQTVTPELEYTDYDHDKNNNLETMLDPIGESVVRTYDALNRVKTITDKRGNTTNIISYNVFHQPLIITAPLNRTTINTYTSTGEIDTIKDAENNIIDNDYNGLGQLTHKKVNNQIVATYTYNTYGDIETSKDGLGRTTTFSYNKRRQLRTTTLPPVPGELPAILTTTYDDEGMPNSTEDPKGNLTLSTFTPTGNPKTVTLPSLLSGNNVITHTYDTRDWPFDISDSLARTTTYTYDPARRLTGTEDPLNRNTTVRYDSNGRPYEITDPLDRNSTTAFTPRGEAETLIDALLKTTGSIFDANGNLTHRTNRRGKTHITEYDAANRVETSTTPSLKSTVTGYYANDLVKTITEPSTQVTTFTYDTRLRPFTKIDPVATVTYGYNDADQPTTITQGSDVITRDYDERGRMKSFTNADGDLIQYKYDLNGNVSRVTYPDGKQVNYTYNERNLLETVTDWSNRLTTYGYDRFGRLVSTTRPNGTSSSIVHDDADQLVSIKETASGKTISYLSFKHDAASQITNRFRAPILHSNFQQPVIDAVYDDDNRITTLNGQTVVHDDDGNMTVGSISEVSGHIALTYNSRNQLTTAPGYSYTYDAEGRRRTLVNSSGTTRFTISPDGNLLVKHSPANTKTYYVYGLGLQYEVNEADETKTHHYDQIGSTILRTDDTGKVLGTADYSAYGLLTYQKGDLSTPFLYNGQAGVQTDPNGLLNMRARYYSPYLMRFLNADPIGFSGGSNWFAYADGNPISLNDPFGLEAAQNDLLGQVMDKVNYLAESFFAARMNPNGAAAAGVDRVVDGFVRNGSPLLAPVEPMKAMGAYEEGSYADQGGDIMAAYYTAVGFAVGANQAWGAPKGSVSGGGTSTVSRWGSSGLETNAWVMKGPVSRSTFVRSFKWEPKSPLNSTNQRVPFSEWRRGGTNYEVPTRSLEWPSGWEKFKGVYGQRKFAGK